MGLKEKGSHMEQSMPAGFLPKKDEQDEIYFTEDKQLEKLKDIFKKKGSIDKNDLIKTGVTGLERQLSQYLLPDDISGSTLPIESDYSLNSRLESMINLLELCKELALAENPDDLWESILFNILGQVGAREAAIFVKDESRMDLKASKGFIFPDDFRLSKRSGIERILQKDLNIQYSKKVMDNIFGDEYNMLSSLNLELIVPVLNYNELFGFILIGKCIGAADYSIEDLLYLKLLGEIIGAFHHTIEETQIFHNHKKLWASREKIYQQYLYFQQQLQSGKDAGQTASTFENYLNEIFAFQAYLFFVLNDKNEYVLVSKKGLQEASYKNLKFTPGSELLFKFQQSQNWVDCEDLLEESIEGSCFNRKFTKEDSVLFKSTQVLPLFFHGNLYGFFVLLKVKNDIPYEYMYYAQNIIITYFWYYLSHEYLEKAEKNLMISITDPLKGVRDALERQEKKLASKNVSFGILIIHIVNFERIASIHGERYAKSLRNKVKKIISEESKKLKFISDLFMHNFILIYENIDKDQLWKFEKSIVKKVQSTFPDEKKRPLLHNRIYARPDDHEKTLEQIVSIS